MLTLLVRIIKVVLIERLEFLINIYIGVLQFMIIEVFLVKTDRKSCVIKK